MTQARANEACANITIGWAQGDITPQATVLISGQMHARLSEGVLDPLTVTAWALQSGEEQAVLVSCDLLAIPDALRDAVRERLRVSQRGSELDPRHVVLHATHTHTAPECAGDSCHAEYGPGGESGAELQAMAIEAYADFAAERIANTVERAWASRLPGSVAFGLGYAVLGRNRRWVDSEGRAEMYRLYPHLHDTFRHIEGFEDHRVQVAATYGTDGELTGLIVNVPCPAQQIGNEFMLSADYWHEARKELRRRFGGHLYILPQCSAAGELVPRPLLEQESYDRMLRLKGLTAREELARRLADAVGDILPAIGAARESAPMLRHRVVEAELPLHRLTESDALAADAEAGPLRVRWQEERGKLQERPELADAPRWYVPITRAYGWMHWHRQVVSRFRRQKLRTPNTERVELHVLRLGDIVFAANPFELYLDFGLQLDLRSPAAQTFLVQLAGPGTYVPSPRSVRGGGYGSVPASNPFGPEAGQRLVEETVEAIRVLFRDFPIPT